MRKLLTLVVALALVAAACGDDDASDAIPADPADISSCEQLADATIAVTQQVIDALGDLDPAALMSGEMPESITELETTGNALSTRGQELECTDLGNLLAERVDQLEADSDNTFGQLIIASIESGDANVFERLSR
jgi:hypothetical protein